MVRATAASLVLVSFLAASASAQSVPDHLECYKIKDPQAKAQYTANLDGLLPEPGCLIKVPAKMACVPTTKTITSTPPPPGGGATGETTPFLCYSVKCPKAEPPAIQLEDQFGNRTLSGAKSKLLCAPAFDPTATTTTTSPCPSGETLCGLECADTDTDPDHCGACDAPCSVANATPACSAGTCTIGSCDTDFGDCTGGAVDGCETDLLSDAGHCGVCNNDCDAACVGQVSATTCTDGSCEVAGCNSGFFDVDGTCSNGCECADSGIGGSICAQSANAGTLGAGQSGSLSGKLPEGGQEWLQVTFGAGGTRTITLTANPGGIYRFDVFSNCSTAVCFNATSCTLPAAGTYQVGIKTSSPTCNLYTVQFNN